MISLSQAHSHLMPLFKCSIFTTLDFSPGCVNASFLPMFPASRAIKRFAQSRVLVDRPDPGVSIQERRRASAASLDRPASAAGFRGSPGLGAGRFRFYADVSRLSMRCGCSHEDCRYGPTGSNRSVTWRRQQTDYTLNRPCDCFVLGAALQSGRPNR